MSYKSLSLSLVDYAAPLLTSAPASVDYALKKCHKRFLRIINCKPEDAETLHNLLPIDLHIGKRCEQILEKILGDRSHPTTIKLNKKSYLERTIQTRASFQFEAPIPKHERYNKSFIPKTLRSIRDRSPVNDQPTHTITAQTAETTAPKTAAPTIACPHCSRIYKARGLKLHIRSCKSKQ